MVLSRTVPEKLTKSIRETSVSRHNRGHNKGASSTPQYDSAAMYEGFQGVVSCCPMMLTDAIHSLSDSYKFDRCHFFQFMAGIGGKEIKQQHAMTTDNEKND